MNTVSLEVGWNKALWSVQPAGAGAVLFGEVALKPTLRSALSRAAGDARLALAGEDMASGIEAVIAFDGSLLWPALHSSAGQVLLGVSLGPFPQGDPYADEVAGRLLSSLLPKERMARLAGGAPWDDRLDELVESAKAMRPKALGLALHESSTRPTGEREAERVLRERLPDLPILLSCDLAPLWGWSDRPVEKTAVSLALLPLVAEAAAGAREGLSDEDLSIWFASQDGTIIPASLALRHPYAVMRGLPILSLTAGVSYAREIEVEGPLSAVSVHETSTALARLEKRPGPDSYSSAILGARIESVGLGAESPVWVSKGRVKVAEENAPAAAVALRGVLAAAGLLAEPPERGDAAARALGEWLRRPQDEAVAVALRAIFDMLGHHLKPRVEGCGCIVMCGPLAGALAGAAAERTGVLSVFLPPAFGACAGVAASRAPRAARSAESLPEGDRSVGAKEAALALEELIAAAVADLEQSGLRRDELAAVVWVGGAKDAHGVFPALDQEAIAKAALAVVRDAAATRGRTVEVEVYPARGDRGDHFPQLAAPVTAPSARRVLSESGRPVQELRVVPAGALSAQSPTQGPALLSDPTGFILVPEGFEARPAPLGGTELRKR